MLEFLHLKNFRRFEDYRLDDLRRLNVLVGRNGSGKSTILEAIRLLCATNPPDVAVELLSLRGELAFRGDTVDTPSANLSSLFHGRACTVGEAFELTSNTWRLAADLLPSEEARQWVPSVPRGYTAMRFVQARVNEEFVLNVPVVTTTSGILFDDPPNLTWPGDVTPPPRTTSIPTESLTVREMGQLWDRIQVLGHESQVVHGLKAFAPNAAHVGFLVSSAWAGSSAPSSFGAIVGFDGDGRRYPLGSVGEGVRRVLALILSIVANPGGVVVVDEVDTGIHWAALTGVFKALIHAAREHDTQLFLTTHSADCVDALGGILSSHDDWQNDVALYQLSNRLDHGVRFHAQDLIVAAEQGIELRNG